MSTMTSPFLARQEAFASIGSTNDVVRSWLEAGTPAVCLAVTDEQTAGRGRAGRTWTAPPGTALLLSLGFRPIDLPPEQVWRLSAVTSMAMADAAEAVTGLPPGTIRLKWPNDLVVDGNHATGVRKLAGVLGETAGLGTSDPRAVVGIGINADWRRADFPPAIAPSMTSLRVESDDRPVDTAALLVAFLERLERRVGELAAGQFGSAEWAARQLTTGREVRLEYPDDTAEVALATGVDGLTGALIVADRTAPGGERRIMTGEIRHLRSAPDPGRTV